MSSSIADLALLGRLFEEHRPRLLAMVERRLDKALAVRIDADEILAEAFLRARGRWSGFREKTDVTAYAWLYGIVRSCLIDMWRRETSGPRDLRRQMPWPEESSVQLGMGLVSPRTSPSGEAALEELRQKVRQTVDLLKESDREILWMRHSDQLTFPEAARVLGITESAATLRYVRALKRLKRLWEQLNPPGSHDQ